MRLSHFAQLWIHCVDIGSLALAALSNSPWKRVVSRRICFPAIFLADFIAEVWLDETCATRRNSPLPNCQAERASSSIGGGERDADGSAVLAPCPWPRLSCCDDHSRGSVLEGVSKSSLFQNDRMLQAAHCPDSLQ